MVMIAEMGSGRHEGNADKIIDAAGNTVLPGLTDCHVHVLNAGINLMVLICKSAVR